MYIDVNKYLDCTCDSDMLQKALDDAKVTGQAVLVPKINKRTGKDVWDISKTVYLHSESTLILQNCHLRLADGAICRMFSNSNHNETQKNITIKGLGKVILDGGIHNDLYEVNGIARSVSKYPDHKVSENCMIFFFGVERLLIENITVKNHRYWGICLYKVSYSRVSNIHLESESNVPNQDGVDLLKGSHDIIIENITGRTGDNCVALVATDDEIYERFSDDLRQGDIYNITIRNVMGYSVGGCAIIRLLNHDGYKMYNIRIDNVIETSPWSENDAPTADNPDLCIISDENGNIVRKKHIIPGEKGYRDEAAIIIGESYWYRNSKAQPGDTYGISVSNVMTHARFALWLNNSLQDSYFDNIRLFGNGFMAAYFGEGEMENVRFSNIFYDKDCHPHKDDEHIVIAWNNTESKGLSAVYFHGTNVKNIVFKDVYCGGNMDSVFGGEGSGNVVCENVNYDQISTFNSCTGINITENKRG